MAAPVEYRTSRPVRRLLFALGGLLALAMVLWGSAQVLDRLSIEEENVVRSYAGVTAIDLRHSHGDVELVPAAGRRVRVAVRSRHGAFSGHDREQGVSRGTLRLRGGCDFLVVGTCEEEYRIEVPRGLSVSVRTSAGEAVARGLRGDLDMRSSAGMVRVTDVRGSVISLRSHAGGVSAEDVRARRLALESRAGGVNVARSVARRLSADTAAGGIDVELVRPPLAVDAVSSAGGVTIRVPDVGYRVEAQGSVGGEGDIQVRRRPDARRTIRIESRAGNVSVLPLPPSRMSAPATSRERDRARAARAKSRR